MQLIEIVTFSVIILMLLLVYRSIVTVVLVLLMVVLELAAARGFIAFLGFHNIIELSTFATNLLVTLAIAAATDYAIFLIGRYQEARGAGEDRETAFYTMYRGTAHVVLGSGLTIAGATFCLHFTNLPYFQSLGIPLAIGMVTCVFAALTLGPAVVTIASRFGRVLEPKRAMRVRGWRKLGAAVVRWPGPILVGTMALALVGLLTLPGYKTNYNDRNYLPTTLPANEGYQAADRHFSQARMNPELLLIESDHDLRNSADFLVIDKIAKAIFKVPGIARVQAITRPQGTPIEHTSIPFQISMQGTTQKMNEKYNQDMMANMLKQADDMQTTINTMTKMSALTAQMADVTHKMVAQMKGMTVDIAELRDNIANFDDFFRPLRNYFYWEPHCYDIPVCWSIRSVFDTLDGIDTMTDDIQALMPQMERLDALMPQLVALMPGMIDTMKSMKTMMLTMYATQKGMQDQQSAMQENSTAMGEAFDQSKNDDSFYLPPEIFNNAEFKRGMKSFISPDGKSVRFIISHEGDPMTQEGISHIDAIKQAAKEAIKGTPLEGSTIYLGRHRGHVQGHVRRLQLRPVDRRHIRAVPDLHHHVDHHAKRRRGRRHRGDGGGVARRLVRIVGAHLAAHHRHRAALDGVGDVGDHPAGRRRRLQPAAGVQVQGRDTRRVEHRDHPLHGWYRFGGDVRRPGVRVHDDVHGGQFADRDRTGRHHHRTRPVVRHAGRPIADDTRHRRATRQVVLVAAESAVAARALAVAVAEARRNQSRTRPNGLRRISMIKDIRSLARRAGLAAAAVGVAMTALAGTAAADATDDYPIPKRIWQTPCDAEQVLQGVRDTSPVYYERYMIDKSNRPADVQQAAVDRINWFFNMAPADRRAYSEEIATNVYGEPLAGRWGNWAKAFFNNKGVAAKATDVCQNYPRGDMSVWDWPVNR